MNFSDIINKVKGLEGIEFGGKTELFENTHFNMPLYEYVQLDGGNIFKNNHFQKKFSDFYSYGNKKGFQYNIDCTDKNDILSIGKKYDLIVTSHVIEHIANPIKTIKLWKDLLLNDNGYILSVIPDYRYCFDRNRNLTTIEHLLQDYTNDVSEYDETHIEEQKSLHDWSLGGHPNFYNLCENNYNTRVVHHHTFTKESFETMLEMVGMKSIISFKHDDLNIINLCMKDD